MTPYRTSLSSLVGIILINQLNLVFVGQRLGNKVEAWQMPQAGSMTNPIEAGYREMMEEIGTNQADFISAHPDWLDYDIPEDLANQLWAGGIVARHRNGWPFASQAMMTPSIS